MKNTYWFSFLWILSSFLSINCKQKAAQKIHWSDAPMTKTDINPILRADSTFIFYCPMKKDSVRWQRADVFNPATIVKNDSIYMLYRCEDNPAAAIGGRTSRIGLAASGDGIHFQKYKYPVLFPQNDAFSQYDFPGGCEDPRVAQAADGTYVMTYTSWNGKTARLSIALSKDLIHWEKKGPAFAKAYEGKYLDTWSKSGSIITKMENGKAVIVKIKDKYWMYWGELFINLAWSENLYDWYPSLDEKGELKAIVEPRKGFFDSHLTECGPPAVMLEEGIVLLYNGRNATDDKTNPKLPRGMYSVGQIIFDKNNPEKVLSRSDSFLMKPTLPHEITGQYQAGTTFAEGLVYFKNQWFIYYGTADSFVGLALKK